VDLHLYIYYVVVEPLSITRIHIFLAQLDSLASMIEFLKDS